MKYPLGLGSSPAISFLLAGLKNAALAHCRTFHMSPMA
jgi:hypothetical protein